MEPCQPGGVLPGAEGGRGQGGRLGEEATGKQKLESLPSFLLQTLLHLTLLWILILLTFKNGTGCTCCSVERLKWTVASQSTQPNALKEEC